MQLPRANQSPNPLHSCFLEDGTRASNRGRDVGYREASDAPAMLELPSCPVENGREKRKGHQKGLRRATEVKAGEPPEPQSTKSTLPQTSGLVSFS